jgi:outer membrane protein
MRAVLALLVIAAATAPAAAEPLTLERAVEAALDQSARIGISEAAVVGARARVKSVEALRYPSINVDANVFLWNEALSFQIADPGMLPPGQDASVTVRDRITSTVGVTVAQPLSGLLVIDKALSLERAGVDAVRAEARGTRADVALQVSQAYFQALQAEAAQAIAAASVRQVEAQLTQARALADVGMLERVDVMRLEAALAAARQGQLQAATGVRLARDSLALAIGLDPTTPVEPVDDFPDPLPVPTLSDTVTAADVSGRPELEAARARTRQAELGAAVAKADLYPNVNAIGTYQHNEGQGTFAAKDSWFVGVTLAWNVWDWGNDWYEVKAAEAGARQAALAVELTRDQLTLQARAEVLTARNAFEALEVARVGLTAAEEAFRIQNARYTEGAATTTDLLQVESEVTQARLRYATARFGYLRDLAAAAHALGRMPTEVLP